ncbi:Holliday junction resolvase RuvX [Dermabacter sp. p3-SID358]|uniref:Holliday junction resolvase RuvX n=1 Tax=Dermabacter sp. p3-SID358 TaxID=2916114 RepID=UPI0021A7D816|nr:Holliday junction resolvase RuvX [Dermabacter sp. p3-SID358]MCT1866035.1 Holliday junction resolvase RuvX [Dermabacter sp. p3-SID358]
MMSRRFVRIGVDVGDARVGVARSDADGLLATPVETFPRADAASRLQALITELEAERLYVGKPRLLSGEEGTAVEKAHSFVSELADLEPIVGEPDYDVYLVDERLSTVSAHRALRDSGRRHRTHRPVIDQVAAVMILQTALDFERARGAAAGEPWSPGDSH